MSDLKNRFIEDMPEYTILSFEDITDGDETIVRAIVSKEGNDNVAAFQYKIKIKEMEHPSWADLTVSKIKLQLEYFYRKDLLSERP